MTLPVALAAGFCELPEAVSLSYVDYDFTQELICMSVRPIHEDSQNNMGAPVGLGD